MQTTLDGNICFNGPRAGINFNDGFGGGHELTRTLMFNMVRETGDHGPFNSWDRQPFIHGFTRNGTAQFAQAAEVNHIHHNFIIGNYGAANCIDTDDGSSYYKMHEQLSVFGGHKTDFGGHDKQSYNSIFVYAQVYATVCWMGGIGEGFYNNTCILGPTADRVGGEYRYGSTNCGTCVRHGGAKGDKSAPCVEFGVCNQTTAGIELRGNTVHTTPYNASDGWQLVVDAADACNKNQGPLEHNPCRQILWKEWAPVVEPGSAWVQSVPSAAAVAASGRALLGF